MRERELFDKVRFSDGDKVRRKFREKDDSEFEIVDRSIEVTNVDGFKFLVIYFKSNPESPFVSAEFEPYDKDDRKAYYEHWQEAESLLNGAKSVNRSSNGGKRKGAKALKFNTND